MLSTLAAYHYCGEPADEPQNWRLDAVEGETILVADDDAAILQMLALMLEDAGYNVVLASDGEEALGMVEAYHPDLVLLDYMMPVIDGSTACQRLKGGENTCNLPVVLMSADRQVARKAVEAKADDYLLKPFSMEDMLGCVQSRLRLAGDRRRDD
ncbi:MAG: response regulator [Chloroflexi bacterium]|nr:response regulator [Chloroflexota bacterium]